MKNHKPLKIMEYKFEEAQRLSPLRLGRITASGIYSIMGSPRTKGQLLTETAKTYLNKRIAERLTGQQESTFDNVAMSYGRDMEAVALNRYVETTLNAIEPMEFIEYGTDCGCTPDGRVIGEKIGVEVKCPYSSAVMVEYLQIRTQEELKDSYPNHYYQIMSSLMFTGFVRWDFVAFDPRMLEPEKQIHIVPVLPDENDFDLLRIKISQSIDYINSML